MKKSILKGLSLMLLASFLSCKSGAKSMTEKQDIDNEKISEYAQDKFGSDCLLDYNSTKEFVLISKKYKSRPSDIFPTIRFQILSVDSLENVFGDSVIKGEVSWIEDYIIEVNSEKSMPGPDGKVKDPKSYKYHVKNRKKFSGGFFKNKN